MGFRYRRRIKLLPGIYLNVGGQSLSLTVKAGPLSRTYSTTGRNTTNVNLPGGASYRTSRRRTPTATQAAQAAADAQLDARRAALRDRVQDATRRRDLRRAMRDQRRRDRDGN